MDLSMDLKIVEAFDMFIAEIDGEIVTFEDRSTAETAVALAVGKEEMITRAANYCTARDLTGKNAAAKTRIITDFMAFEATRPTEQELTTEKELI